VRGNRNFAALDSGRPIGIGGLGLCLDCLRVCGCHVQVEIGGII
jgi:hypothetical protein